MLKKDKIFKAQNFAKEMLGKESGEFSFSIGDVILAKYEKDVYYAKVMAIDYAKRKANLLFDDDSREDLSFDLIFNVNETTSDIICVVCKTDQSENNDDIVLCDKCNIGYHQNCHIPYISSNVLAPEIPWECYYCENSKQNPYIEKNPFDSEIKNLIKFDSKKREEQESNSRENRKPSNPVPEIQNQEVPQIEDELRINGEAMTVETDTHRQWLSPEYKQITANSPTTSDDQNKVDKPITVYPKEDSDAETKLNKKRNLENLLATNFSNKESLDDSENSTGKKKSLLMERLTQNIIEPLSHNSLNHNNTSAFQVVKSTNNNNVDLNDKIKEKIKVLGKRNYEYVYCNHQDRFNDSNSYGFQLESVGNKQCRHSDYFQMNTSKNYNIKDDVSTTNKSFLERPTELSIDVDNNESKSGSTIENSLPTSKIISPDSSIITAKSIEKDIIDQRFAQDLPRHNWLEERIRQRDLHNNIEKKQNDKSLKGDEKVINNENDGSDEIKILHVESLSTKFKDSKGDSRKSENIFVNSVTDKRFDDKIQRTNFSYSQIEECLSPNKSNSVKKSHKISLEQLSKNVFEKNYASESEKLATYGEIFVEGSKINSAGNLQRQNIPELEISKEFDYNKFDNCESPDLDILEINMDKTEDQPVDEKEDHSKKLKEDLFNKKSYDSEESNFTQPKIITESPSKQYSIPSNEDLKTVKYTALSSDAKQSPTVSSKMSTTSGSLTPYISKPSENNATTYTHDIENDRERFIEKHRSKTSVVPATSSRISPAGEKRMFVMHDKPKGIHPKAISEVTNESIKRKIEIQRQLESQKRWIDEHDTRQQIEASMTRNRSDFVYQSANGINKVPSIGDLSQNMPQQNFNNQKQILIQKQQQELEKRLAVFTKEIEDLKRQKELLHTAQNNLAQEEVLKQQQLMEARLRNLQEYRQAQTMQFMRANPQAQVNPYMANNPPSTFTLPSLSTNNGFPNNQLVPNQLINKNTNNYLTPQFGNVISPQFSMNNASNNQIPMNMGFNKSPQLMNGYPSSMSNMQNSYSSQNPSFLNPSQLNTTENMKLSRGGRLTDIELEAIRSAEIQQAIVRKSTIAREYEATRAMDVMRGDINALYRRDIKVTSPTSYRRPFDQREHLRRSPPKRLSSNYDSSYLHSSNKYSYGNNGILRPTAVSGRPTYEPMNRQMYSPRHEYKGNDQLFPPKKEISPKNGDNRACKICNDEAQFLCSGCRLSWYCSQKCQLSDWKTHAKICKTMQQQSNSNGKSSEKLDR